MKIERNKALKEILRKLEIEISRQAKGESDICGVTLSQCNTIVEIGKCGEVSIIELAKTLGIDASSLSRNINGMVNIGLVNRILNASDRRYVSITLSEQGKKLYDQIESMFEDYIIKVFEFIPEDKEDQMFELFSVLAEAVEKCRGKYGCACE